jgi:hypothetical protein
MKVIDIFYCISMQFTARFVVQNGKDTDEGDEMK